jgi:Type IV secretion system pilin
MSIVKNLFKGALFGLLAIVAVAGLVSTPAFAADVVANPCRTGTNCIASAGAGKEGIAGLIFTVAYFLLYLIGGISVLFLVYGGFQYILSGGDEAKTKKARATISNAIIGLVVALVAATIVSVVSGLLSGSLFGS